MSVRFTTPDELLNSLQATGVADEIVSLLRMDLEGDDSGWGRRCRSCGRFSSSILEIRHEGEVVYSAPHHMAYVYRQLKPVGLCSDCFEAGRFSDFSAVEIDYFRETFCGDSRSCGSVEA
jgi:hypothetical protein